MATSGTLISEDQARVIAGDWHGGQWTPLYAFSSSGTITSGIEREIISCMDTCMDDLLVDSLRDLLRFITAVTDNHNK